MEQGVVNILKDVIKSNLDIVFCGTAAGNKSAQVGFYYASPNNKFWSAIHQVGLTPLRLKPEQYTDLLKFNLGLTDLVKKQSGNDRDLPEDAFDLARFEGLIEKYQPKYVCFNGKEAAKVFLKRKKVAYGLQKESINKTRLFVAPSTSGAASKYWDIKWWQYLVEILNNEGKK